MKIVVNKCFGGFGLSTTAKFKYLELKNGHKPIIYYSDLDNKYKPKYGFFEKLEANTPFERISQLENVCMGRLFYCENDEGMRLDYSDTVYEKGYKFELERNDPILVKTVELLGSENASNRYSELKVIEIPDEAHWEIEDYDGQETLVWSMSEINNE